MFSRYILYLYTPHHPPTSWPVEWPKNADKESNAKGNNQIKKPILAICPKMILEVYWDGYDWGKTVYVTLRFHQNEQLHNYHTLRYYWSNHCIYEKLGLIRYSKKTRVYLVHVQHQPFHGNCCWTVAFPVRQNQKQKKKKRPPNAKVRFGEE